MTIPFLIMIAGTILMIGGIIWQSRITRNSESKPLDWWIGLPEKLRPSWIVVYAGLGLFLVGALIVMIGIGI